VLDKPTARKNIQLGLWLALFAVLVFAATIMVGEIVTHA
jgi:hypothetical protein